MKVNVEADTAEMASLWRGLNHVGLAQGEVLFVKCLRTPQGLGVDQRTGGCLLGASNLSVNEGNYHANLRWLDGTAALNQRQQLAMADKILSEAEGYTAYTLGIFEVASSRLGTVSDVSAELRQISTDIAMIRLP